MPIEQARLIKLLNIIEILLDNEQSAKTQALALRNVILGLRPNEENIDQIHEFGLAATEIPNLYLSPSAEILADFYRESEHFRVARKRNERSKLAMRRAAKRKAEQQASNQSRSSWLGERTRLSSQEFRDSQTSENFEPGFEIDESFKPVSDDEMFDEHGNFRK